MGRKKKLIPIALFALLSFACVYIVTPAELKATPTSVASKGWNSVVTNVGKSDSGICILILRYRTIRRIGVR